MLGECMTVLIVLILLVLSGTAIPPTKPDTKAVEARPTPTTAEPTPAPSNPTTPAPAAPATAATKTGEDKKSGRSGSKEPPLAPNAAAEDRARSKEDRITAAQPKEASKKEAGLSSHSEGETKIPESKKQKEAAPAGHAEGEPKSPVPKMQTKYSNSAISEAQADFAVKLLQQISQQQKDASVIMSPISVAVTLAMVYAGAKGETKAQHAKLIGNGASDEEIHLHFSSIVQELSSAHCQADFSILDTFRADIQRYYRGEFQLVDFERNKQAAAREINAFVAAKTRGKIHDIVKPNSLAEDTRLILINAIYFKGLWKKKFVKSHTRKEATFYVSEGKEAKVDMMQQSDAFMYYSEDADVQVLGMPYEGDELNMFIILPRKRYGLRKVLESLNGKKLAAYLGKRHEFGVDVSLPRFKVESSMALVEALTTLGATDAFNGKANFEGIAEEPTFISEAYQNAFIEVNEEGAEAAAVTRCHDYPTMNDVLSGSIPQFVADHPFLYAVTSGTADVLFAGIVSSFQ
ncbi:BmSERPIN [Aphelenchoides avenae]|nr:BmSERPIN [Aphelenchus avenae]